MAKLYYRVFQQAEQEAYEAVFGRLIMPVDDVERRFTAWPDWSVTTRIDTTGHWGQVDRAVVCHRSQLPDYPRQAVSDDDLAALWAGQTFYRAMSLVNGGRAIEDDLFEGLRRWLPATQPAYAVHQAMPA